MSALQESSKSNPRGFFRFSFICTMIALTIFASANFAQPPLGAADEVWVDVPDTAYVGQEVEFQVYMANGEALGGFATSLKIYSSDGAQWDWVEQPSTEWEFQGGINIVSIVDGFRFWDYLPYRGGTWGPEDSLSAKIHINARTFEELLAPAGPLEHAYSIHLRPTMTGTICIDSTMFWTADEQWWYFNGQHPAWNGPFCFTMVEPPVGDVDCNGMSNIGDAVYLINWIFKGGPEPCR